MPLITDRDLLIIEPAVFTDAATAATRLTELAGATVVDTTLQHDGADFESDGIGAGRVAVINGVAVEIVGRVSSTQLQVSLPRASAVDAAISPGDAVDVSVSILTFSRLIEQMQTLVLRGVGIDPDDPAHPLDASSIRNADAVGSFIARQVIAEAFAVAAAAQPENTALAARAALAERQAERVRHSTAIVMDTDGDGAADFTRPLDVIQFRRR